VKDIKTTTFWRKTYPVEAVRLTLDNYRQIADFLGGDYFEDSPHQGPYILVGGVEAVIGDWVYKMPNDSYRLDDYEDFLKDFHTHDEQMAKDEKYAKVFQHVVSAMSTQASATYHQDTDGMDLVAIETVKKILGEL
jgi:hypothetical protein